MDMQMSSPIGIHVVSVSSSEAGRQPRLVRGIVYAFAIQSAAAIAIAASWILIKS